MHPLSHTIVWRQQSSLLSSCRGQNGLLCPKAAGCAGQEQVQYTQVPNDCEALQQGHLLPGEGLRNLSEVPAVTCWNCPDSMAGLVSDCLCQNRRRPYCVCSLLSRAAQIRDHRGPHQLRSSVLHGAAASTSGKNDQTYLEFAAMLLVFCSMCAAQNDGKSLSPVILVAAQVWNGAGVRGPGGGDRRGIQCGERGRPARCLHLLPGCRSGQNHHWEQGLWCSEGSS